MRIIAGKYKGLTLANVGKGDLGAHLRPTTDRVRENLFNILGGGRFGDPITGARVLDLFAGTGGLGLEALSRGASHVTFVDDGRKAQSLLRDNITRLGAQGETQVLSTNATRLPQNPDAPYDLIFLDPPYDKALGESALDVAIAKEWIAPSAFIVWEESAQITPPSGLELLDTRRYGSTSISFLEMG